MNNFIMKLKFLIVLWLTVCASPLLASELSAQFATPPAAARPWVYWFWNNGNVTKAGITADLEAMQRAGIGGVIIMDVVERFAPPPGTADFMNAEWQELFRFAVAEAHRLGLEINMTNGPGWCGSSGPWITPEFSMQHLVLTQTHAQGPHRLQGSTDCTAAGAGPLPQIDVSVFGQRRVSPGEDVTYLLEFRPPLEQVIFVLRDRSMWAAFREASTERGMLLV